MGLAVVTVTGELAADAADRVPGGQCRSGEVEQGQVEELAPPGPQHDTDRTTDGAAVPGEPGAGEEVAEDVVLDLGVVVDEEIEAGTDQTTDERGEGHLVGPVLGLVDLTEATVDDRARNHEGHGEHEAERLQGEGPEVDLRKHGARDYSGAHGPSGR